MQIQDQTSRPLLQRLAGLLYIYMGLDYLQLHARTICKFIRPMLHLDLCSRQSTSSRPVSSS